MLRHFIAAVFTLTLLFAPAQDIYALSADAITGGGSIPVNDKGLNAKEVGQLKVFGVTVPGSSWDSVAINASKRVLEQITNSTVKWINSGFDGNPAYVTDPKQYFSDIADGIAGEFIQGSELGFLCSPFQANIKLSLAQEYYEPNPFQCTLTGVVGNIENFYKDFSQGGWDAWFSMTQNPSNNPYGAYLEAKIELDSRIANAVGLKDKELQWGGGFMSWSTCAKKNPPNKPYTDANGVTWNSPPDYVPGKAEGECIKDGPIQTPGKLLETGLSNTLGGGIRQLELADEFDEIASALMGQLLQKTLFNSTTGLRKTDLSTVPGTGTRAPSVLDIDGDGVPDGQDNDNDGELDWCFFGNIDDDTSFSPPCRPSGQGEEEGGQCLAEGNAYEGILRDAMDAVLAERPDIGDLPNIEEGGRQNARRFLALVVTKIESRGYHATDTVLNGNNNPSTGDIIAVWKDGDDDMERYDAIIGGAATIRAAVTADFTGFIPLNCTTAGGGNDCGCNNEGGGEGPVTTPGPVYPYQICSLVPGAEKQGGDSGAPVVVANRINPAQVIWDENPEVGNWAETARLQNITTVGKDSFDITLAYDKAFSQSTPWPQVTFQGRKVVGNTWIIVWRNGAWHGSTFDWILRPDQTKFSAANLLRGDGALKGVLGNFNPINTQTYGFMVSTPARNGATGLNERSQILTLTWNEPVCRPDGDRVEDDFTPPNKDW